MQFRKRRKKTTDGKRKIYSHVNVETYSLLQIYGAGPRLVEI